MKANKLLEIITLLPFYEYTFASMEWWSTEMPFQTKCQVLANEAIRS